MSSMYRAAQKLYTSATAPSKKQKAKQEGWRVENLAAAPSAFSGGGGARDDSKRETILSLSLFLFLSLFSIFCLGC